MADEKTIVITLDDPTAPGMGAMMAGLSRRIGQVVRITVHPGYGRPTTARGILNRVTSMGRIELSTAHLEPVEYVVGASTIEEVVE